MPVGESFYNLQFPYFASYIVMFIAGIITGENNMLDKIADEKNIRWIPYTLIIGLPLWCVIMVFGGALEGKTYFNGGLHWQNGAFALWESLTAIGFSTGLIALFKKRVNTDNKFTRLMRDNAFGIYFFHAPILITVSLTLKHWIINPLLKFIIAAAIAVFITLIFSFLIRKIKPVGMVIK